MWYFWTMLRFLINVFFFSNLAWKEGKEGKIAMRDTAIILLVFFASCVTCQEYVGCYKDSDPRDLPQRLHDREVTVSSCVKNCKDLYYRYAGLQFSYLCFCGNKRGRYGQLPEWKCSSECSNKEDKHCGGYWSNSIYKTGYDPPAGVKITPLLKAALIDLKPRVNATKHKDHKASKKNSKE